LAWPNAKVHSRGRLPGSVTLLHRSLDRRSTLRASANSVTRAQADIGDPIFSHLWQYAGFSTDGRRTMQSNRKPF